MKKDYYTSELNIINIVLLFTNIFILNNIFLTITNIIVFGFQCFMIIKLYKYVKMDLKTLIMIIFMDNLNFLYILMVYKHEDNYNKYFFEMKEINNIIITGKYGIFVFNTNMYNDLISIKDKMMCGAYGKLSLINLKDCFIWVNHKNKKIQNNHEEKRKRKMVFFNHLVYQNIDLKDKSFNDDVLKRCIAYYCYKNFFSIEHILNDDLSVNFRFFQNNYNINYKTYFKENIDGINYLMSIMYNNNIYFPINNIIKYNDYWFQCNQKGQIMYSINMELFIKNDYDRKIIFEKYHENIYKDLETYKNNSFSNLIYNTNSIFIHPVDRFDQLYNFYESLFESYDYMNHVRLLGGNCRYIMSINLNNIMKLKILNSSEKDVYKIMG